MDRNKNLLILYYLWEKLSKFSNAQKKVSHVFSFQPCSTTNSKFSFYFKLGEINCIKIQTMGLVLNRSIIAEILCVLFTLTSSSASDWKKRSSLLIFFQSREQSKNMWSCGITDTGHAQRPILQSRDSQSLNWDPPLDT